MLQHIRDCIHQLHGHDQGEEPQALHSASSPQPYHIRSRIQTWIEPTIALLMAPGLLMQILRHPSSHNHDEPSLYTASCHPQVFVKAEVKHQSVHQAGNLLILPAGSVHRINIHPFQQQSSNQSWWQPPSASAGHHRTLGMRLLTEFQPPQANQHDPKPHVVMALPHHTTQRTLPGECGGHTMPKD